MKIRSIPGKLKPHFDYFEAKLGLFYIIYFLTK